MRITVVTGPWFPVPPLRGGATSRIWKGLAEQFARQGHEVTIMSCAHPQQKHEEVVEGVKYLRWGSFRQSSSLGINLLKDFWYALRVLPRLPSSDILVINDFWLPFLAVIRKSRVGKVLSIVGRYPKGQHRYYFGVDRIVTPSEAIANVLLEQAPRCWKKLVLIPHPVDTQVFSPPRSKDQTNATVILYVGRVHPEKGIHILLEAFSFIHEDVPNAYLQIVGPYKSGEGGGGERYLEELREKARNLPVEFCGPVYGEASLVERYQQAQVFCYPSLAEKGEAFGLAPLEAMSCGLVPIVSSLECFGGHVVPDRTGIVFDHTSFEASKELAHQMLRLLKDKQMMMNLSRAAREKALECSYPKVAQMFLDDFEGLLEN